MISMYACVHSGPWTRRVVTPWTRRMATRVWSCCCLQDTRPLAAAARVAVPPPVRERSALSEAAKPKNIHYDAEYYDMM